MATFSVENCRALSPDTPAGPLSAVKSVWLAVKGAGNIRAVRSNNPVQAGPGMAAFPFNAVFI